MALDTVEAALAAEGVTEVIVVTRGRTEFAALGARVIDDPGTGLNAAIARGVSAAPGPTAVLLGDHPALAAYELADALGLAADYPRSLVADSDGTGSALTASLGTHVHAFGVGSRAAHIAAGYVELVGDWPGLRRDVDTAEQLRRLPGLGRHTLRLLGEH